ncbi:PE-PPE domain-containing protein [Mycobacterium deserti]|uniref:PE-PPE domain-containing protein n=1 Tax=Mycobacterium deserti TaxID=2978347 RepID=A0ABT2M518_9MYCO|nr:PE-PPE domain-containing protein [Mycobacterium deserti]MCT7657353.1 PE-PPE domain-containing protein [Mycobacterium deserti]
MRSLGVVILALASTVAIAVAWTTAATVQLLATALIMGGTDHPLTNDEDPAFVSNYLQNAINGYIGPASQAPTSPGLDPIQDADGNVYAVIYPAGFTPVFRDTTFGDSVDAGVTNLTGCVRGDGCDYNTNPEVTPPGPELAPSPTEDFVIFGYSQSAVVASLVKRDLIATPRPDGADTSFFLLANPMRPNGGVLARSPFPFTIPILNIPFYGATPTNSCDVGPCMPTVDVAAQYDGLGGDAPASLTNVLAILNAAAGYYYFHGDLQNRDFEDAEYQGHTGDTDYYLIRAQRLPILKPVEGFVPSPILTLLDAPLRVLIEGAYARDVDPGVATKVGLLPFRNPVATAINLLRSIPTGIDDALAEVTGDPTFRPLGTAPVTSPFGVGGPELPEPPSEELNDAAVTSASSVGDDSARQGGSEDEPVGPVDEAIDEATNGVIEDDEVIEEDEVAVVEDEVIVVEEDDEADSQTGTPTTPVTDPETPDVRGPVEFDSREPARAPLTAETGNDETTTAETVSNGNEAEAPAA